MTKKDFAAIAAAIEETRARYYGKGLHSPDDVLSMFVINMLPALRASNPAFDAEKFLAACGPAERCD